MGNGCSPAVACDVYDGVFLCCPFFSRAVYDEILNLIESVSEGFPIYSYNFLLNYSFSPISTLHTQTHRPFSPLFALLRLCFRPCSVLNMQVMALSIRPICRNSSVLIWSILYIGYIIILKFFFWHFSINAHSQQHFC